MYPLSTLLRGCWTDINLHLRLKLSFLRYRFILRKYSFFNNNNNNIEYSLRESVSAQGREGRGFDSDPGRNLK
jgi:hypothetical protein